MKGLVKDLWICMVLAKFACGFKQEDVTLVGGQDDYEGRVEVFLNDHWGTVDDDPWDNDDAGVVCRQLGYLFGGTAYRSAHFGQGSGPIWLDEIGCIGTETYLLDCPHQTDTSEDRHNEDVGVACNGKVRLVGGNGPDEGRVEIFMNGRWGTLDDDPWDDDDAGVVCRQLGYLYGGIAFTCAHFGQGTGSIWLDDIQCVGNEPNLLNFSHGTDTSEDTHSEDVGVTCAWPVRLINGSVSSQGRVEVLINGQWGTINHDDWDDREAAVVCTQLGHPSGGIAYSAANFGEGTGPILLENLNCAGSEFNLFHCPLRKVVSYNSYSQDAGVACFDLTNDLCHTQPCANNGKCVNQLTSFFCVCPIGFNGTRCENEINEPCKEKDNCLSQGSSLVCVTEEKTRTIHFERLTSYISLILATCALVAATICLVKINKMTGTLKQQIHPGPSAITYDNVQMHLQNNKYRREKGCAISYDKERQGASWQVISSDNKSDDGQDVYEICDPK